GRLVRTYFNLQNRFAALDAVTMLQMRGLNADAVYERPVRRAQITQETLRRGDLDKTVMARKKTIMRQTEMCVLAPADHERIMLFKGEVSSGLWAGHNIQGDTHPENYKLIKIGAPIWRKQTSGWSR